MRSITKYMKPVFTMLLAIAVIVPVIAQTTAPAPPSATSGGDGLVIMLGFVALLLAFVIYALGQVLLTFGRQTLEKGKQGQKIFSALLLTGLSLVSLTSTAADDAAITEPAKALINYGSLGATGFWILSAVIALETATIGFMLFMVRRLQSELLPQKAKAAGFDFSTWWKKLDKKLFTKAVAVEKEADILLDHDYDGIKELDNSLPPWWKYGFVITIFVAVIYMLHFHVMGSGKNPTEEYAYEMKQAEESKAAFEAKNADRIDETNLKMPEAEVIAAGKEIFSSVCWACHGKEGEGGAGPNLTDDYWIHKGSLSDIYQSIKKGYPDKGMQGWAKNFSPKQINGIAAYIKNMKGTKPANAKAPQGDLYMEAGADSTNAVQGIDSLNMGANTSTLKK